MYIVQTYDNGVWTDFAKGKTMSQAMGFAKLLLQQGEGVRIVHRK